MAGERDAGCQFGSFIDSPRCRKLGLDLTGLVAGIGDRTDVLGAAGEQVSGSEGEHDDFHDVLLAKG